MKWFVESQNLRRVSRLRCATSLSRGAGWLPVSPTLFDFASAFPYPIVFLNIGNAVEFGANILSLFTIFIHHGHNLMVIAGDTLHGQSVGPLCLTGSCRQVVRNAMWLPNYAIKIVWFSWFIS